MESAPANRALWNLPYKDKGGELNAARTRATHEMHEKGRRERRDAEKK